MKTLKKDMLSWITRGVTFLFTVIIGSVLYASVGNIWVAPSSLEASSWSTLVASSWNSLLANFSNLDNRTNTLSTDIGNLSGQVWALNTTVSGLMVIPTGMIAAFNSTVCPTGWKEAAWSNVPTWTGGSMTLDLRGRFPRGIDNGAGNDPSGTRVPWSVQADELKSHTHDYTALWNAYPNDANLNGGTAVGHWWPWTSTATGGAETRPKNVAVLFCVKN